MSTTNAVYDLFYKPKKFIENRELYLKGSCSIRYQEFVNCPQVGQEGSIRKHHEPRVQHDLPHHKWITQGKSHERPKFVPEIRNGTLTRDWKNVATEHIDNKKEEKHTNATGKMTAQPLCPPTRHSIGIRGVERTTRPAIRIVERPMGNQNLPG